ncbi:TIGR02391 family protein [Streptomyces sp. NPDC055722]
MGRFIGPHQHEQPPRRRQLPDLCGVRALSPAAPLHPWVWGSVQGLWSSGHFREVVGMAAKAVNAQAQAKPGRKDLSEAKLGCGVFQNDPAQVAGAFRELLVEGRFEEIVFGVLDRTPGTTTRAAFAQAFADVCVP